MPWQLSHWWHDYIATAALILMGVGLLFFQKLPDLGDDVVNKINGVVLPAGA